MKGHGKGKHLIKKSWWSRPSTWITSLAAGAAVFITVGALGASTLATTGAWFTDQAVTGPIKGSIGSLPTVIGLNATPAGPRTHLAWTPPADPNCPALTPYQVVTVDNVPVAEVPITSGDFDVDGNDPGGHSYGVTIVCGGMTTAPITQGATTVATIDDYDLAGGSAASPNSSTADGKVGVTQDADHLTWVDLTTGDTSKWARAADCRTGAPDATTGTCLSSTAAAAGKAATLAVQTGTTNTTVQVTPEGGFNTASSTTDNCPSPAGLTLSGPDGTYSSLSSFQVCSTPDAAEQPDDSFVDGESAIADEIEDGKAYTAATLVGTAADSTATAWARPFTVTYSYPHTNADCALQAAGELSAEVSATTECSAPLYREWYAQMASGLALTKGLNFYNSTLGFSYGRTSDNQYAFSSGSGDPWNWVGDPDWWGTSYWSGQNNLQNGLFGTDNLAQIGDVSDNHATNCSQTQAAAGVTLNPAYIWTGAPGLNGTSYGASTAFNAMKAACDTNLANFLSSAFSGVSLPATTNAGGTGVTAANALGQSIPDSYAVGSSINDRTFDISWPVSSGLGSLPAPGSGLEAWAPYVKSISQSLGAGNTWSTSILNIPGYQNLRKGLAYGLAESTDALLGDGQQVWQQASGVYKTTIAGVTLPNGVVIKDSSLGYALPCDTALGGGYELGSCTNATTGTTSTWTGTVWLPVDATGQPISTLPTAPDTRGTLTVVPSGTAVTTAWTAPSYSWQLKVGQVDHGHSTTLGTVDLGVTDTPPVFGLAEADGKLTVLVGGKPTGWTVDNGDSTTSTWDGDSYTVAQDPTATWSGVGYLDGNSTNGTGIDAVSILHTPGSTRTTGWVLPDPSVIPAQAGDGSTTPETTIAG